MKLASTLPRFRLIDGVIVAAIAMLALKVGGLVYSGAAIAAHDPPAASSAAAEDGLPSFGRAIAHARTNYIPGDPTTTGSVPSAPAKKAAEATAKTDDPDKPPVAPVADPAKAGGSPAEQAILEHLGERREQLQERTREMETRQQVIEESERRLDARMNKMKTLEEEQHASATKHSEAEAAGLKNLVTMYETMKPKEAARVFDRLPQDVLVPVVTQMNPRKMADVLAAMSPETAEKLTIALARRANAGGPAVGQTPNLPPGELPAISPGLPASRPANAVKRPLAATN